MPVKVHLDPASLMPESEWMLYRPTLRSLIEKGLRFTIGGGFTFSLYSGHWRNTKDIDLFVEPQDRDAFVEALSQSGFEDYYDRDPYRRTWIYRAFNQGLIIDVIWQMANDRAQIDHRWYERRHEVDMQGLRLPLAPPEELAWAKLYVLHRDRCDWPDVLNIFCAQGPDLDWDHLIARAGEDRTLLSGLMCVFWWLCPARARQVPQAVWSALGLANLPEEPDARGGQPRAYLIDSYHDWFGPRTESQARGLETARD